tara:strand:+ start:216 stop:548 length:333 start_codon:yes stop_codon:yes gene_type:complete
MQNYVIRTLIFIVSISLMGCSMPKLFQVVINQGNLVKSEMIEKLEAGMTESQVKYIMGTPLINDTFAPNRWDYFTSVEQGNNTFTKFKITLFFNEGKLEKWEGDLPLKDG